MGLKDIENRVLCASLSISEMIPSISQILSLLFLVPLKERFLRMPGGSWAQKMPLFTRWLELQLVVDNTRMFSSLQLCQESLVCLCVCVCTRALCKNVYRCVCAWVHMLGLVSGVCQQNPNSLYCFYVEKTTSPWIHSVTALWYNEGLNSIF